MHVYSCIVDDEKKNAYLLYATQRVIHNTAHCLLGGDVPIDKMQQGCGAEGAPSSLCGQA
jgi:hypothetical protein